MIEIKKTYADGIYAVLSEVVFSSYGIRFLGQMPTGMIHWTWLFSFLFLNSNMEKNHLKILETLFSILSAAIVSYLFLKRSFPLNDSLLSPSKDVLKWKESFQWLSEKSLLILVIQAYKADDTKFEITKANLALMVWPNSKISSYWWCWFA